jgi:hypothetical protein
MFFAHYNVKLSNTWHDKQKVFHPLCIVKIRHGNRDILCFRSNFVTYISFSTCLFICVIISLHSQSDSNRSSRAPKLHGSRFPGLERSVPILHGLHPCCLSQQILLGKKMFQKMCVFPDFLSAKPTIWCMLYTLGKIYIDLMMNSGFVLEIQSLSLLSKPNLLFNVHQNDFKIWPCVLFIWRALCSVTRLVHIPSSSPTKNRTLLNCILEIAHIMRGWHVNCVDTHGQEIRCPNLKVI